MMVHLVPRKVDPYDSQRQVLQRPASLTPLLQSRNTSRNYG